MTCRDGDNDDDVNVDVYTKRGCVTCRDSEVDVDVFDSKRGCVLCNLTCNL